MLFENGHLRFSLVRLIVDAVLLGDAHTAGGVARLSSHVDACATWLAAQRTSEAWTSPRSFTRGPLTLVIDHPPSLSTVVAEIEPSISVAGPMTYTSQRGVTRTANVVRVSEGRFGITSLSGWITARLHQTLAATMAASTTLNAAAQAALTTRSNELEGHVVSLAGMSPILLRLPEDTVILTGEDFYLHAPSSATYLSGVFEMLTMADPSMPAAVVNHVATAMALAIDHARRSPTYANLTDAAIRAAFGTLGAVSWGGYEGTAEWVRVSGSLDRVVAVNAEINALLTTNKHRLLHLFGYYVSMAARSMAPNSDGARALFNTWTDLCDALGVEDIALEDCYDHLGEYIAEVYPTLGPSTANFNKAAAYIDFLRGRLRLKLGDPTVPYSSWSIAELAGIMRYRGWLRVPPCEWPASLMGSFTYVADTGLSITVAPNRIVPVDIEGRSMYGRHLNAACQDVALLPTLAAAADHLFVLEELFIALLGVPSVTELFNASGQLRLPRIRTRVTRFLPFYAIAASDSLVVQG